MTDRFDALAALVHARPCAGGAGAGSASTTMFKDEALVIDKWFALQAGAPDRGGDILPLRQAADEAPGLHACSNPNRARSLIFSYCSAQPGAFHRRRRSRLRVLEPSSVIELDAINPQVAARLARALDRWSQLAEPLPRARAREAIARVAGQRRRPVSKDVARGRQHRALRRSEPHHDHEHQGSP